MSSAPKEMLEKAKQINEYRYNGFSDDELAEMMWQAAVDEREKCAKIAEDRFTKENVLKTTKGVPYITGGAAIYAATRIAEAIRRR